ncbi:MAG: hypothetical protein H6622_04855 [Halobacteriovoraceae bacterium]|nr:hypothetical protein [Halobacteriovoraceae bacterium]
MKKIKQIEFREYLNNSATAVVLLHGYGADCNDLFNLGGYLDSQGRFDWYFPNGILEVPIGPFMTGRAWFPIRMMDFQNAVSSGEFPEYFANQNPEGLDMASEKVQGLLNELSKNYDKIIIGGFSQGAMMATDIVLNSDLKPKQLLILSGAFTKKQNWSANQGKIFELEIFQSHGQQDPVLPYSTAILLRDFFINSGSKLTYRPFIGGHEIPPNVLGELANFIGTLP